MGLVTDFELELNRRAKPRFATWHAIDLHNHTPASDDYGSPQKFCYANNSSGAVKEECSRWTDWHIPRLTFESVPFRPC